MTRRSFSRALIAVLVCRLLLTCPFLEMKMPHRCEATGICLPHGGIPYAFDRHSLVKTGAKSFFRNESIAEKLRERSRGLIGRSQAISGLHGFQSKSNRALSTKCCIWEQAPNYIRYVALDRSWDNSKTRCVRTPSWLQTSWALMVTPSGLIPFTLGVFANALDRWRLRKTC